MKHLSLVIVFCFSCLGWAYAQQETTLGTMRSLPQSTYINPAFVPEQTFYLGLPGISSVNAFFSSNSPSYKEIKGSGIVDTVYDETVSALNATLKENNWLYAGGQMDLLSLGFRANPRLYLRYRFSLKLNQRLMLPGDIGLLADANFLDNANAVSLSPTIKFSTYLEHAFGGSYMVNQKLTVGANIKKLSGITNIHVETLNLNIRTNPDEELLEVGGELLAYTSGEGFLEDDLEIEGYQDVLDLTKNNGGWAVDLGATYQYNDKLKFGLSILDLGTISWGNSAREYRTNKASFRVDNARGEEIDFEALADSADKYLLPQEKNVSSYRNMLPTRTYLSATYQLHRSVEATGIIFAEWTKDRILPGFTAAIHKEFGRRLGTSLSYTAINGSYLNFGAGMSFRLTPFQLYLVTDNMLGIVDAGLSYLEDEDFSNVDVKQANLRLGLNLVFGTIKKPSKLPY